MDRYEQHKLRIADITREANYSFWNALLTLNGVLVSVFSFAIVFTASGRFVSAAIVVASMLSAFVLILNFRSTRNTYRTIGQVDPEELQSLSDTQRQKQIDDAVRAHASCNRREGFTHVVLAIQAVLILCLLFSKVWPTNAEGGADQPATAVDSRSEGGEKPKSESKARSQ